MDFDAWTSRLSYLPWGWARSSELVRQIQLLQKYSDDDLVVDDDDSDYYAVAFAAFV